MGRLSIHSTSYGTIRVIGQAGHVYVGKYCSLADNIKAIMLGHNPKNISTYPFNRMDGYPEAKASRGHPIAYGRIHIENDVWIGHSVTLIGGIIIADGAVIASDAVVTKNIDPYTIVGGNPAKEIGKRFDSDIIDELLNIRWWDWEPEKIKENSGLLCSEKIDEFIKKHGGK